MTTYYKIIILLKVKNSGLFISTIATLNFHWNCQIGIVTVFCFLGSLYSFKQTQQCHIDTTASFCVNTKTAYIPAKLECVDSSVL